VRNVVLEGDLECPGPELTRRLHAHLPVHVGIEEGGVRVEAAQGALDGAVTRGLGRHFVDVLALDDREHLGERRRFS